MAGAQLLGQGKRLLEKGASSGVVAFVHGYLAQEVDRLKEVPFIFKLPGYLQHFAVQSACGRVIFVINEQYTAVIDAHYRQALFVSNFPEEGYASPVERTSRLVIRDRPCIVGLNPENIGDTPLIAYFSRQGEALSKESIGQ